MTAFDRFDRVFEDVLADLAQPSYPDYIDDVLTRATTGSQRPAWTFPERWLPMRTMTRTVPFAPGLPWRNLGLLALLALLAAALLADRDRHAAAARAALRTRRKRRHRVPDSMATSTRATSLGGEPRLIAAVPTSTSARSSRWTARASHSSGSIPIRRHSGRCSEQASLMIANADGSGMQTLLRTRRSSRSWVWSPDSRSAGGRSHRRSAVAQLSIVPIDGSAATGVRLRCIDRERRRVASAGRPGAHPPAGIRRAGSVLCRPADGSAVRQITRTTWSCRRRRCSPSRPTAAASCTSTWTHVITLRILDIETGDERVFGANLPPLEAGHRTRAHRRSPRTGRSSSSVAIGTMTVSDAQPPDVDGIARRRRPDAEPVGPALPTPAQGLPFVFTTSPDGTQIVVHRTGTTETWSTNLRRRGTSRSSISAISSGSTGSGSRPEALAGQLRMARRGPPVRGASPRRDASDTIRREPGTKRVARDDRQPAAHRGQDLLVHALGRVRLSATALDRRVLGAGHGRRRSPRSASGVADNLTTGGWLDPTSEVGAGLRAPRGRVRRRAIGVHRAVPIDGHGRRRDAPRRSRTRSRRRSSPSASSTRSPASPASPRRATSGSSARRATPRTS